MNERRAYLKRLASQSARHWSQSPLPAAFVGETRIETKNTVYRLTDGVCHAVSRHDGHVGRMAPSEFVGMRLVGWLMRDDPQAGVSLEWKAGAYAVLWRPRAGGEEHSAVALTSSSQAFRLLERRVSSPPPLPRSVPQGTLLPRPATPSSWIPPVPASTTRLHLGPVPTAPDTPTPPRRGSSMPPPLPPRPAQGVRPLHVRAPG